jgi:hypothetical protein
MERSRIARRSAGCFSQSTKFRNESPGMQRSDEALRVISDTNQARTAITHNNSRKAKACIDDALTAINTIQTSKTANSANQTGRSRNLVPIYSELGQVTVLGPVVQQQERHARLGQGAESNLNAYNNNTYEKQSANGAKVGSANRTAEPENQSAIQNTKPQFQNNNNSELNNNRQSNNGEVNDNGEFNNNQQSGVRRGTAVQEVAQEFTSITLNTDMAKDHLEAARNALEDGNRKAADSALAAVQDGVTMVSVAADRPLLKARENLILARQDAERGQFRQMRAPLTAAANALNTYCAENTPHANSAKRLSSDIRSYAQSVNPQMSTSNSVRKINNWWEQTGSWSSQQQ